MPRKKLKISKSNIIKQIVDTWIKLGLIKPNESIKTSLELMPVGMKSLKKILVTVYRLSEYRNKKLPFEKQEIDHLFKAGMGYST